MVIPHNGDAVSKNCIIVVFIFFCFYDMDYRDFLLRCIETMLYMYMALNGY
jgi:hypothetical protein